MVDFPSIPEEDCFGFSYSRLVLDKTAIKAVLGDCNHVKYQDWLLFLKPKNAQWQSSGGMSSFGKIVNLLQGNVLFYEQMLYNDLLLPLLFSDAL